MSVCVDFLVMCISKKLFNLFSQFFLVMSCSQMIPFWFHSNTYETYPCTCTSIFILLYTLLGYYSFDVCENILVHSDSTGNMAIHKILKVKRDYTTDHHILISMSCTWYLLCMHILILLLQHAELKQFLSDIHTILNVNIFCTACKKKMVVISNVLIGVKTNWTCHCLW